MAYTAVYTASDLGSMIIDVIGGLFNALAVNIGTVGVLVIFAFIAILATDALTGIFGIFRFLKSRK